MRCWAAALLCCCCTQAVEDPIGADAITYLDDEQWSWVRGDDGFTIPASVPGDVVTDLQRAGDSLDLGHNVKEIVCRVCKISASTPGAPQNELVN